MSDVMMYDLGGGANYCQTLFYALSIFLHFAVVKDCPISQKIFNKQFSTLN